MSKSESNGYQVEKVRNYLIDAENNYHPKYGTTLFPAIVINN